MDIQCFLLLHIKVKVLYLRQIENIKIEMKLGVVKPNKRNTDVQCAPGSSNSGWITAKRKLMSAPCPPWPALARLRVERAINWHTDLNIKLWIHRTTRTRVFNDISLKLVGTKFQSDIRNTLLPEKTDNLCLLFSSFSEKIIVKHR